jgi:hypothetical protein
MNRILAVMAMGTGVFLGAQALAVDAMQYSTASQRRMTVKVVGCMKKRMAADRIISYYEAQTACKDQVNKRSDGLTAGTLAASMTAAKP